MSTIHVLDANTDIERMRREDSPLLENVLTHIYLPFPFDEQLHMNSEAHDALLARVVHTAIRTHSKFIHDTLKPQWRCIERMLGNLEMYTECKVRPVNVNGEKVKSLDCAISQLSGMETEDIIVFLGRIQDTAVVLWKQDSVLYKGFPLSLHSMAPTRSCYKWAKKILNNTSQGNHPFPGHAWFSSPERDPSFLCLAEISHIIDGDFRAVDGSSTSWKRSPLWLLIKVAIQMTLDRDLLGRDHYKVFILHLLCYVAEAAVGASLSDSLLHAMSTKILRRLRKLGASAPSGLYDTALRTSASLQEVLEARWKIEQAAHNIPLWDSGQLNLDKDMKLSRSGEYIRYCFANTDSTHRDHPFTPNYLPRATLNDLLSSNGRLFENAYRINSHAALYDIEREVAQGIDDWVACVTHVDQACSRLEVLMDKYWSCSRFTHQNDPEHLSTRLLTMIELWVALDKLAAAANPMLAQYPPAILTTLLHKLILRRSESRHRLRLACQYLSARRSRVFPANSILSDESAGDLFAIRYFINSPHFWHHIGEHAPIPSGVDFVVFELACSMSLHIWASVTARLLGCLPDLGHSLKRHLDSLPALAVSKLQPFIIKQWTSPVTSRVYLAFLLPLVSHPWTMFFDTVRMGSVYPPESGDSYSYQLPSSQLHLYINSTSHTSNDVLVSQVDHTDDLLSRVSEFVAFGHLRSGGSLQWLNMLRELRSRSLNLRRHDSHLLFSQAASQVGPFDLDIGDWPWHQELQELSFCFAFLDELESLLTDVGVYALDGVMMGTISFLLTHFLASCCHEDISEQGIRLLQQVRRKTFKWVQDLSYDLMMAPTNMERSKLLRDMAAVCRSTFDVGPTIFHKVPLSAEDIEALLSCGILVHAHSSIDSKRISEYSQLLLERDRRLSFAIEGVLRDAVLADASNRGIDLAIRDVWPGYRPGSRIWQPLIPSNSHWLTCETAATGDRSSQMVHLNLLDGTFLVCGKPINVLPPSITTQELYQMIFGDVFLVIPSDLPGMDLSTIGLISDHRVHFALRGGGLVIQAQYRDDGDILQAIPQTILQGDLPAAFINCHVHWLNLSTRILELRPLGKIWECSSDNWRIDCTMAEQYRMYKGCEFLVDIHSPTWKMISDRFRCLDNPENLVITTIPIASDASQPGPGQLSVLLHRYGLSFFINQDGNLESCDFKNMVYDSSQCIGTLFGLDSRLVLESNVQVEEGLIHRCVIIPDGLLFHEREFGIPPFAKNGEPPRQFITYNTYKVDTDMGCLTGCTSLKSKLYLAYLHMQTSVNWRPDPLTGRTGIQEALRLLRSAGCRSIMESDIHLMESELLSSSCYKTYPQISFAIAEIRYFIGRERFLRSDQDPPARPWVDVTAMQRSAYLFPFDDAGPSLPVSSRAETAVNPFLETAEAAPHLSETCEYSPERLTLSQLFLGRPAPKLPAPIRFQWCKSRSNRTPSGFDATALQPLFDSIHTSKTETLFQNQYTSRLHNSARHLRNLSRMSGRALQMPQTEELRKHYVQSKGNYMTGLTLVKEVLAPKDDLGHALHQAGQWPSISPAALFQSLASTSSTKLSEDWKQCLVSLALLIAELQRARRLLRLSLDKFEEELSEELENEGCDGWTPMEHIDWLLIQIQGDFLIRGKQANVAFKMISPSSGESTTIQVNIGEGKSSVILPISAMALADGKQLVRVIVPKALVAQTFRVLVDRLGGIVNRAIYYLPFSRAIAGRYSHQHFEMLHEHLSECVRDRGILVVQPEHVLSLKLTAVEKQIPPGFYNTGDQISGDAFLKLQRWVQSHCRDIVDEADEVLHPRFHLTYAIGNQQHMEGYPDRWEITQQVLRLVRKHTLSLSRDLPDAIECDFNTSGSFPRIRILRASDAPPRLMSLIVDDVMDGQLSSFSFPDINRDRRLRAAVRAFISSKEVSRRTADMVEEYARKSTLWNGILLLRGLLSCNILLFALAERRWCVDYGLCPKRTMLAVPYRAKDVPAPSAEFGHPDITIVLTCLSYYYGGLTEKQLRSSFEILQEQDESSTEYANWLRDHDLDSLPESIQDFSNLNTKSSEQWDKYIFPLFTRNQGAVDYYLSKVVFPNEAKEYSWKLAASSWDFAEERGYPITGFSGTNDSQYLLPTSITPRYLDHQRATDAMVLSYILQPENNSYTLMSHASGERRTMPELLAMIVDQEPKVRVLLDVGAQVLDFSNYQVAKTWLCIDFDVDGAIYFDEDDELMVLTKDGSRRSLISTPLAQRLDRCVVYLDDAHTRGTDLKFPEGFRAAVTLGPKVTKDRLVQGCMRMRRLGRGHSVIFLAPLEVDGSIRAVCAKQNHNQQVNTIDILRWTIYETWTDIWDRTPYWAQEGVNHGSKCDAWIRFCNNELTRERLAEAWLQPEHKSLADLYAPFASPKIPDCSSVLEECAEYSEIQQRCIDIGVLKLPAARMDEEQEREITREIEHEREVQKPRLKVIPAKHDIHPDVVSFVRTGAIPPLHIGNAFHPVFATLGQSSVDICEDHLRSPHVLATTDFCQTIDHRSDQDRMVRFLRPVQWVVSRKNNSEPVLVILSPFEADYLMPDIRVSENVYLHVYTPRTSKYARLADDLVFYSIPHIPNNWTPPVDLIDQLNLFAGQLYLKDYDSLLRLRRLLGIHEKDLPKSVGTAIRRNQITPGVLEEVENTFKKSPLPSVMKLLAIRRGGLAFGETHMGRILQGQSLTEEDFSNPVRVKSSRIGGLRAQQHATGKDNPECSAFSRSYKRGREMADLLDGDSGQSHKRARADLE